MVPTLLEPGERVFLPGQWENSGIAQLNSVISRFQVGGQVNSTNSVLQYLQNGGETNYHNLTTNNSQRGGE